MKRGKGKGREEEEKGGLYRWHGALKVRVGVGGFPVQANQGLSSCYGQSIVEIFEGYAWRFIGSGRELFAAHMQMSLLVSYNMRQRNT